MKNSAKFITLEGVDGAGKTTHIEFIKDYLSNKNIKFLMTREPGGTEVGEKLRELLLHDDMTPETETLLMFAARNEHIQKIILPNLSDGVTVITDRFTDATYAYQCEGKSVDEEKITILKKWTHKNLVPDLTLLFDLPVEISMSRLKNTRTLDKFEKENQSFHETVRNAYLKLANKENVRFEVIDSTQSIKTIQNKIKSILYWILK